MNLTTTMQYSCAMNSTALHNVAFETISKSVNSQEKFTNSFIFSLSPALLLDPYDMTFIYVGEFCAHPRQVEARPAWTVG
jgi:hypothetical protein